MRSIPTAPHFWLVQLSQHCFQADSGENFLVVHIPKLLKYQTRASFIFSCWNYTPWCPVVLQQGGSFDSSACAGLSPGCCSLLWYQTCKWGRGVQTLLLVSPLPVSKPGEERNLPGVCKVRSQALEVLQQLSIVGDFLFSLPHFVYQQQNTGVFCSFLRFNSKWESSIHHGPYSSSPSNPDGFFSCASLHHLHPAINSRPFSLSNS